MFLCSLFARGILFRIYFCLLRRNKIVEFPLTRLCFKHPILLCFISKNANKKVNHRPSTKYLYFHKITGLSLFFSGEKKNRKNVLIPTDQIFFSMLVETQLFFYALWGSGMKVSKVLHNKESTLKGKNLLPWGANSFLLEKTPFQKGPKTILKELPPLNMYPFALNVKH